MSGVEQQHLRSAQSSRSLSLPQAAGGEWQLRSQLWVWLTVQVSSAITKSVPPLGTWGIFQPMQRSPIAQPPRQHQQVWNAPLGRWQVLSEDTKYLKVCLFFPWCAKCNAIMRFAWGWRFLLQWLNSDQSTPSVPAPRKHLSCSWAANVLLGNAGRRWICLCLHVALKTALCNLTHVVYALMYRVRSLVLLELLFFGLACFRIFDFVNYNQWSSMFQRLWHRNSLVSWSVR